MKRADCLSRCNNGNVSTVSRDAANVFADEDDNVMFLSEGNYVVFVVK